MQGTIAEVREEGTIQQSKTAAFLNWEANGTKELPLAASLQTHKQETLAPQTANSEGWPTEGNMTDIAGRCLRTSINVAT